jgi:hypothetical protein
LASPYEPQLILQGREFSELLKSKSPKSINDHINTVLASFCCCKKCLDNFSFADILNITQPFADLNEHNHTTFIINIMSASCVPIHNTTGQQRPSNATSNTHLWLTTFFDVIGDHLPDATIHLPISLTWQAMCANAHPSTVPVLTYSAML